MKIFNVYKTFILNDRKINSQHSKHLNLFNTLKRYLNIFHLKYYKVTSSGIYSSRNTTFMSLSNKFTEIYYSSKREFYFQQKYENRSVCFLSYQKTRRSCVKLIFILLLFFLSIEIKVWWFKSYTNELFSFCIK